MQTGYQIVRYTPAWRAQVLEIQRHLWSDDMAVNDAYMAWKYEMNPYSKDPCIYLALHHEKVVGMRGFFATDWVVGQPGRSIGALGAGDLVVAPEHRNRGLFTKIMSSAVQDLSSRNFHYLFNLSSGLATRLGSLTMGWRSPGAALEMCLHDENVVPHVQQDPNTRFQSLDQSRDLLPERISLDKQPRSQEMAELVDRLDSGGRIRHRRDPIFFSWRFQNPLSRYRFLFWTSGALDGYLVLQSSRLPRKVGLAIVDWEGATMQIKSALLETALRHGRFGDVRIWSATLDDATRDVLIRYGFRQSATTSALSAGHPCVLLLAIGSGGGDYEIRGRHSLDMNNWELRMSDSDNH